MAGVASGNTVRQNPPEPANPWPPAAKNNVVTVGGCRMNTHNKLYTALLGAAAVLLVASAAVAQSEMTTKIRLECAAGSVECPGSASQFDFSVSNSDFGLRKTGASADAIHVNASNGFVGFATSTPGGNLHVFGTSTNDVFNGIGPDPVAGPAFNFGYAGFSFGRSAGFFNVRPDGLAPAPNPSLRFATSNLVRMTIDNEGFIGFGIDSFPGNFNPGFPLHHAPSGAHLTVSGVWTDASSRDLKENIVTLSSKEARSALLAMKPVTFDYRADPTEKRVGFIAEDVPELVADNDRKSLAPMDIVGVLARVVQEHERTIAQLRAEIEALKKPQP